MWRLTVGCLDCERSSPKRLWRNDVTTLLPLVIFCGIQTDSHRKNILYQSEIFQAQAYIVIRYCALRTKMNYYHSHNTRPSAPDQADSAFPIHQGDEGCTHPAFQFVHLVVDHDLRSIPG